jgi:hypothetical protein
MQEELNRTPQAREEDRSGGVDACLYCPCCSHRLTERKCKLLCEICGYFMSCADYH